MKTYKAYRVDIRYNVIIVTDENSYDMLPKAEYRNQRNFDWGNESEATTMTALSILRDALNPQHQSIALLAHMEFKYAFLVNDCIRFEITLGEIQEWLGKQGYLLFA